MRCFFILTIIIGRQLEPEHQLTNSLAQCEGGSKHHPFGRGLQALSSEGTLPCSSITQLPISSVTNGANDDGAPICLTRPGEAEDELAAFQQLAKEVSNELLLLRYSEPDSSGLVTIGGVQFEVESISCSIEADKASFSVRLYSESGATKVRVPAANIRDRDPKTGELLSGDSPEAENNASSSTTDDMITVTKAKAKSKPRNDPSIIPTSIEKKGKYGFAVEWDDGATIIYSMHAIAKTAAYVANTKQ